MNLSSIFWCAEEVEHQSGTPLEVHGMCMALDYLQNLHSSAIIRSDINTMAEMIKPETYGEFRLVPVRFGNGNLGLDASLIPHTVKSLLEAQSFLSPLEFYVEFEKIHPFIDGNGRVGALLYNYLNNTIFTPVHVPYQFKE